LPIPVRAYPVGAHTGIFPFATRANTSTGILLYVPVLVLARVMSVLVRSLCQYQYGYFPSQPVVVSFWLCARTTKTKSHHGHDPV
jgi:hypothetical protein